MPDHPTPPIPGFIADADIYNDCGWLDYSEVQSAYYEYIRQGNPPPVALALALQDAGQTEDKEQAA